MEQMVDTFSVTMDGELKQRLDAKVGKGRFGNNRSQAITYCIQQVLDLEEHEERYIEFIIDFLEIVKKHPEVGENLCEFLKKRESEEEEVKKEGMDEALKEELTTTT
jgi:Arc/MetJ-type ribon-helix-helix transcriptional regulator